MRKYLKKKFVVTIDTFRQLALSFHETTEEPHFEKTSFRVKKKIFATYDKKKNQACLKLSESEQDVFSLHDRTIIHPVDNKWGKQGWTIIEMKRVKKDIFIAALISAYNEVARPKLSTPNGPSRK